MIEEPLVTFGIVILLAVVWKLWPKVFKRRPQRHYDADWDGYYATCFCGYHSVDDWNLHKHFEEMGRVGK